MPLPAVGTAIPLRERTPLGISAPNREHGTFQLARNSETYEVEVTSNLSLDEYQRLMRAEDWERLEASARAMRGKTVVFVNPTMEGGGVAMLRPPLVHILHLLGVDAHWYVTGGRKNTDDPNPYLFTKRLHNILQRRTAPDVRITDEGKAIHQAWNAENAEVLCRQRSISTADVIVIDDPQPAPLIPHLKACNPSAKYVWRSHTDNSGALMQDPATAQGEVWAYLRDECGVGTADAFIFHPVESFVPLDVRSRAFFVPATIDPYDDLNRPLSSDEVMAGIGFINDEIAQKNDNLKGVDKMELVKTERPRIALIARFDESKGMDIAIALGVAARERSLAAGVDPEILIIGNGSVDDPSGTHMYDEIVRCRQLYAEEVRRNIVVMRLRHNYAAMNAVMRVSSVGLQTSLAEGFETRVSDWQWHGVPVIVSNRGGMSLQVTDGISGLVLDYDQPNYDLERGAAFASDLLVDPAHRATFMHGVQEQAQTFTKRELITPANATRLLRVFNHVLAGDVRGDAHWRMNELAA